jgi:CRISPR-associated protein Cmr4
MNVKTILWQAITPIHTGVGQTSASVIDLPIARETATNYPVISASSIKGVLRDGRDGLEAFGFVNKEVEVDGKKEKNSQAADLTLTDARVLCLPVRSYKGTYALLTCPLVLQRLTRDRKAFGLTADFSSIPSPKEDEALVFGDTLNFGKQVILEDIDLTATESKEAQSIGSSIAKQLFTDAAEQNIFLERFAIVHNDVFTFFSETAMEVSAHIALESNTKTVKDGGLWYEEAIPAETIFSSFATSTNNNFSELEKQNQVQIGGKASVGRGLLRMVVR